VFCPAPFGNVLLAALLLGQSAPIRVPVRLVVAPTLVLSPTGHVISGLEADKFELLDNGCSQQFRMDVEPEPLSVVIAIQANDAVSDYLPFVAKTGSVAESLLLGANGKAAVLSYSDDVKLVRTFDSGDVRSAFAQLSTSGQDARMLDATERGIQLLKGQPASRVRVLLLIGQAYDKGSTDTLAKVTRDATAENCSDLCFGLASRRQEICSRHVSLPQYGLARRRSRSRRGTDFSNPDFVARHEIESRR